MDDWQQLLSRVPKSRHWYFSKKATRIYTEVRYEQGDALVFGSESQGLPEEWLKERGDRSLRIPTRPEVRSLNLSNSVAIASYEALRQWNA